MDIMDYLMDFIGRFIMPVFLVFLILIFLGYMVFIPVAIYDSVFVKHKTLSLRLDEWICTKTNETSQTSMIISGKVMVPVTTVSTECVQYNKK